MPRRGNLLVKPDDNLSLKTNRCTVMYHLSAPITISLCYTGRLPRRMAFGHAPRNDMIVVT